MKKWLSIGLFVVIFVGLLGMGGAWAQETREFSFSFLRGCIEGDSVQLRFHTSRSGPGFSEFQATFGKVEEDKSTPPVPGRHPVAPLMSRLTTPQVSAQSAGTIGDTVVFWVNRQSYAWVLGGKHIPTRFLNVETGEEVTTTTSFPYTGALSPCVDGGIRPGQ